ncbi:hypothetical protein AAHC03_019406 [Spirometra sp. Aus1]
MASRSFLDCMDEFMSPLEKAQSAVMKDDAQELLPLLAKPEEAASDKVHESTLTNEVAGENLLDFAVHQLAGYCVTLLTAPPFSWSPDRKNVLGETALMKATKHPYLPVIYPLVAASDTADILTERNLASLLLTPSLFFKSPLTQNDLFLIFPTLFNLNDDLAFRGHSLRLLLELILANPELAPFLNFTRNSPLSPACEQCCRPTPEMPPIPPVPADRIAPPSEISIREPLPVTTEPVEFPGCLALAISTPEVLVSSWWWHRLRVESLETNNPDDGDKNPHILSSPLLLSEWCRVAIRRSIVNAMKGTRASRMGNYAKVIASMALPPRLHAFLAYRDLWPTCERHRITRLRQNRFNRPRPRLGFLDDDRIFPLLHH